MALNSVEAVHQGVEHGRMHPSGKFQACGRAMLPAHCPDQRFELREARDQGLSQLNLFDQLDAAAGGRHVLNPNPMVEPADRPHRDHRADADAFAATTVQQQFIVQMHWFTASPGPPPGLLWSSAISRRVPRSLMTTK